MKRYRKSKKKREESDQETIIIGTSITDVPSDLLIDIFSRLSVKSVFRCRFVCKLWLSLLLDPNFAKLHFSRSPTCPLLRDSCKQRLAKALYLVDFEQLDNTVCDVNMKLDTIFMLPERPTSSKFKVKERRFDVVNSCNGFLCLRGTSDRYPIAICNPVTGEYSVLPIPDESNNNFDVGGLGYCSKTNQYKVLLMIFDTVPNMSGLRKVALIYTLGFEGGVWRRIGYAPYFERRQPRPAFLNNALHWSAGPEIIISFDFEGEQFHALPSYSYSSSNNNCAEIDEMMVFDYGKIEPWKCWRTDWRMGVLSGCICLCLGGDLLIMKKQYGAFDKSWVRKYSGCAVCKRRWPIGGYQPIDFLSNGNLLMYYEPHGDQSNAFLSYDGDKFKYFKFCQTSSRFEVIAHVPNFASLKEIVGNDMKVLNVNSSVANNERRKKKPECLVLAEEDHRDM